MIRWHLSSLVRLITSCWYSKLPQQSLHQGPAFQHTDPQPMIRQFQVIVIFVESCGILHTTYTTAASPERLPGSQWTKSYALARVQKSVTCWASAGTGTATRYTSPVSLAESNRYSLELHQHQHSNSWEMPDFTELAPVISQDPRRGDAIHQKILKQYETIINDHQEISKGANKKQSFFHAKFFNLADSAVPELGTQWPWTRYNIKSCRRPHLRKQSRNAGRSRLIWNVAPILLRDVILIISQTIS